MTNWYTIKVKYIKEFTDGTLKKITEPYLVNAMSFTDAEARIYKEVGETVRGEFLVTSISKTDFADIFHYDDAETWYKAKVSYVTEDADTGKEKKVNHNFLVSAENVKESYERIEESLKGLMVTFEIPAIAVTQIVEIFPYEPGEGGEVLHEEQAAQEEEEDDFDEANSPKVNVAFAVNDEEE